MTAEEFDPYQQWLGIPPSVRPIDYYTLLGIERYCQDRQRIEQAAEERMRLLRSFQTGPRGVYTQKLLNELMQAKLRLLDPKQKAEYDARLKESEHVVAQLTTDDSLTLPPSTEVPPTWLAQANVVQHPYAQAPVVPWTAGVPVGPTGVAGGQPSGAAPQFMPRPSVAGPVVPPIAPIKGGRRAVRRNEWLNYVWLAAVTLATVGVAIGLWILSRSDWLEQRREQSSTKEPTDNAATDTATSRVVAPDPSGQIRLLPENATRAPGQSGEPQDAQATAPHGVDAVWEWTFLVGQTSLYEAELTFEVRGDPGSARWEIALDGGPAKSWQLGQWPTDGGQPVTERTAVYVRGAGQHSLSLRLRDMPDGLKVTIHSLVLKRKR